jgi:hypothetical protein
MKQSLRNQLYNTVVECRRLLERDFSGQIEGTYGVHADGTFEPIEQLKHLDAVGRADRRAIEAYVEHEKAIGATQSQAQERYIRESAFTFLNRLAAFKLMEYPSRALIQPSIEGMEHAKGFRQFAMLSPAALRGEPDGGYRLYLELLFDDLSQTLGALFDRTVPTSILFPTQSCLQEVLALLNNPELASIWGEDETIGWIYQYFTPGELREEARKASSSPRNSYELAFRNQFYTPHYVVAFLVDNTLGRLWWEMREGETRLVQRCQYLIRPDPIHEDGLTIDDLRLTDEQTIENRKSQIVNREKRDPRKLRILDPASGSGHYLLYCFDLLLTIYEEAYDDPDLGPALRSDYGDREAFRRAIPKLILEHNLYGVDIDLRAVQIAELALWLRAQRAYAEMGFKMSDRPPIDEIHAVCAEPMPGEYDLLGEFSRDLKPSILSKLVLDIWEKMKLAGEAGSLLKIEQEIEEAIQDAHQKLASMPPGVQLRLFGPEEPQQLQFNPKDLDDETFWDQAGDRVVETLRAYAQRAGNGKRVMRRLFARDAEQGIAFVDVMRRRYDVVLMNPPFGAASEGSKDYIKQAYPRTKNDLYAAFVERGLELLRPPSTEIGTRGGYLGAITSRTGFFLSSFQTWREEILLEEAQMIAMADLGYGVLDTAMVETAAYVLEKTEGSDD